MDGLKLQAIRGFRLDAPGHPRGVSCDAEGPAMGPIRLLTKTDRGFEPRPSSELSDLLSKTFGLPIDASGLGSGLHTVARALNNKDLALAVIATTQMRLPQLSDEEARRAADAVAMNKAAPDDPKHPGWPAGASDGRGGQFRPKDAFAEGTKAILKDELRRYIARQLVREAVLRIITPERVLRLTGEAASNAIPVLNVAGDIALAADIAIMSAEFITLKRDAEAALDFIKKAPYKLEELRVDSEDRSFSSYSQFKKLDDFHKYYGSAESGYQYHHIVEQGKDGEFPASNINSTGNIIKIPRLLHEAITAAYAKKDQKTGPTLREKLEGTSFHEQQEARLKVLHDLGIIK